MIALALAAALAAFVLFALATDRQHRAKLGTPCPPRRRRTFRIAAWVCVALDFALAGMLWGRVFGPVGWAALLMAGAAASFLALNFIVPDRLNRR